MPTGLLADREGERRDPVRPLDPLIEPGDGRTVRSPNRWLVAGAGLILDDSKHTRYSVSVLSFWLQTLERRPMAVRAFLRAWDRAAADINADPESYRSLLLEKIRVPQNVQATFKIPQYPRGEVPDKAQWLDVIDWMTARNLIKTNLAYEASVSRDFLP